MKFLLTIERSLEDSGFDAWLEEWEGENASCIHSAPTAEAAALAAVADFVTDDEMAPAPSPDTTPKGKK